MAIADRQHQTERSLRADIVAASTALRLGDDVRQEFDQLILTAGTPVRHDQPAPPDETESSSTKSGSTGP